MPLRKTVLEAAFKIGCRASIVLKNLQDVYGIESRKKRGERMLLNHEGRWDSWPPEEQNSIQGQRQGLIAQSFCVIKFY